MLSTLPKALTYDVERVQPALANPRVPAFRPNVPQSPTFA